MNFLAETRNGVGIRNIMIGIKTKDRNAVKQTVKELEESGEIMRVRGKKYLLSDRLPRISLIVVTGTDAFGELKAEPLAPKNKKTRPSIFIKPNTKRKPYKLDLREGDQALAKLELIESNMYSASIIRKVNNRRKTIIGIYHEQNNVGIIEPTDRKFRSNFIATSNPTKKANSGDLVAANIETPLNRWEKRATVIEILESNQTKQNHKTKLFSQIAIHGHGIPHIFNDSAIEEAGKAKEAQLENRDDLRNIGLITIDDENARDFDDAVFAEPDPNIENPGGWHIIVAIADVAYYVRTGDELDKAAAERGNSVYFPDMVIPMIPEALSNHWCSLKPNEDRPCLAVHLWIDSTGQTLRHKFVRGLMKSRARLTYSQIQAAVEGIQDDMTSQIYENTIKPLFGAYKALQQERLKREPLDLDLPEKRVVLDENYQVQDIKCQPRFDSHKLIEEFMIASNVAAAKTLEERKQIWIYRVHDEPTEKNLASFRNFLKTFGFKLPKGQVLKAHNFNQILNRARENNVYESIAQMTLRTQTQAIYATNNSGHFGLSLRQYCHFTSPIRRYADLIIHRLLIETLKLENGRSKSKFINLDDIAPHLCVTERRAALAEREVIDRFSAAYLETKIGEVLSGKINGVTKYGLFVTLDETAADGLIPIRSLPEKNYKFDEKRMTLRGLRGGKVFYLGMRINIIIKETNPVTGSLILVLNDSEKTGKKNKKTKARIKE